MKRIHVVLFFMSCSLVGVSQTQESAPIAPADAAAVDAESEELMKAKAAMRQAEESPKFEKAEAPKPAGRVRRQKIERADSFVATADWEFDGFVAGGQDQASKSLFYLTDLVYLNIGSDHGLQPGEKINIFKRGNRVRDPQTGRVLGYEVRRAALSEVTDKVDEKQCSARIIATFEGVEIGDLVRRVD